MPSSTLTIQVGQCGNQVGQSILECLDLNSSSPLYESCPSHFRESPNEKNTKPIARSILIDTEPKVISKCLNPADPYNNNNNDNNDDDDSNKKERGWRYSNSNASILSQSGCGNNSALGSSYLSNNFSLNEEVLNQIRREYETNDYTGSISIIHSLAGGTGSGLGSSLTSSLRDIYSAKSALTNTVISPFPTGEVIVQDYNTLLTLDVLQSDSDGIMWLKNSEVSDICKL